MNIVYDVMWSECVYVLNVENNPFQNCVWAQVKAQSFYKQQLGATIADVPLLISFKPLKMLHCCPLSIEYTKTMLLFPLAY